MRFLLFMFSIITLVSYATPRIGQVRGTAKDSVRYIYRFQIPAEQLRPTLDTMDAMIGVMGKTMSVDQADANKELLTRQIFRIVSYPKLDSIIIKLSK